MGWVDQGGDQWCILRTNGQRTLRLAASLSEAGIEAWTPEETQWQAKTRRKLAAERKVAILPTFVFARASHLNRLYAILRDPASRHPAFSIMRHAGQIPVVDETMIAGLRDAEVSATRLAEARRRSIAGQVQRDAKDRLRRELPVGHAVAMPGPFTGFTGLVTGGSRKEACVVLPGGFRMKIDTWLVAEDVARVPELA